MTSTLWPKRFLAATCMAIAGAVSGVAQEAPEQWTVVYIGDSGLPEATRFYAEQIEKDFRVNAFYTQRNTSMVLHATRMLQSGAWNVVGEADVVVVLIANSKDRPGFCTDQPGDQPKRWTLDEVSSMIDGFLQTLSDITDPEAQIIRIANEAVLPDDLARWKENGVATECLDMMHGINQAWSSATQKYGFTLIDFFEPWSGPDGTAEPPSAFYLEDGRHLTTEGAEAAAALLLEPGYQPLEP